MTDVKDIEIYKGDTVEFTVTLEGKRVAEMSGYTAVLKVSSGFTNAFLTVTGDTWYDVGASDCLTVFYVPYFNHPPKTYTYQVEIVKPNYRQVILQEDWKVKESIP
ncbi:MAG TPA: hypothetical protein VK179_19585 [Bacteroidales bacterium]|nr:hypothetical protein [Bacteroidales bacterium]